MKPRPRLSDITSATALREVTPSGTVISSIVQVPSLAVRTEIKKIMNSLSKIYTKCAYAVNCSHIFFENFSFIFSFICT